MLHPNYGPASAYSVDELHNLWAHYAAESELVDRWIGRILQKIDDLHAWDDTIVALTSDHGMSLGEHQRTGKSNIHDADSRYWPLYPELGHVPFLVAGGDVPRRQKLHLIAQPIDILPTLLDLAEVSVVPDQPLDGESFAAAVVAGTGTHRTLAVSGAHIAGTSAGEGGAPPLGVEPVAQQIGLPRKASTPFLVTDRWGYAPVGADGKPELYDLIADPLASDDIVAARPEVAARLHGDFLAHLAEHRAPAAMVMLWGAADGHLPAGMWATNDEDAAA
jgi:hypothetical protein